MSVYGRMLAVEGFSAKPGAASRRSARVSVKNDVEQGESHSGNSGGKSQLRSVFWSRVQLNFRRHSAEFMHFISTGSIAKL